MGAVGEVEAASPALGLLLDALGLQRRLRVLSHQDDDEFTVFPTCGGYLAFPVAL